MKYSEANPKHRGLRISLTECGIFLSLMALYFVFSIICGF